MRQIWTVVSCEHPVCPARLVLTQDQLAYDSETDLLRHAGWTSVHGSEDRCPEHRFDLST
jgi:hypothetical protein